MKKIKKEYERLGNLPPTPPRDPRSSDE